MGGPFLLSCKAAYVSFLAIATEAFFVSGCAGGPNLFNRIYKTRNLSAAGIFITNFICDLMLEISVASRFAVTVHEGIWI